jgi:D-glycerate 3-kinase
VTPADGLAEALATRIAAAGSPAPLIVGLTGPQGSGKSTLAAKMPAALARHGLRAAVLSLDDLYLAKAERLKLAREVHPLLATRGVPGTHDVALGVAVLASLGEARETLVPRFDKAADDRLPRNEWVGVEGPAEVIVFEGWCVGARPQPPAALAAPVNALERTRDPDGVWRRYANEALAGPYRALFDPIGFQALLLAPGFDVVLGWREQQEHALIASGGAGQTDAQLAVFIQYYERLTRWIATEMPGRADATARLDRDRDVVAIDQFVKQPTPSSPGVSPGDL